MSGVSPCVRGNEPQPFVVMEADPMDSVRKLGYHVCPADVAEQPAAICYSSAGSKVCIAYTRGSKGEDALHLVREAWVPA